MMANSSSLTGDAGHLRWQHRVARVLGWQMARLFAVRTLTTTSVGARQPSRISASAGTASALVGIDGGAHRPTLEPGLGWASNRAAANPAGPLGAAPLTAGGALEIGSPPNSR